MTFINNLAQSSKVPEPRAATPATSTQSSSRVPTRQHLGNHADHSLPVVSSSLTIATDIDDDGSSLERGEIESGGVIILKRSSAHSSAQP